jgi:hypothetical protein
VRRRNVLKLLFGLAAIPFVRKPKVESRLFWFEPGNRVKYSKLTIERLEELENWEKEKQAALIAHKRDCELYDWFGESPHPGETLTTGIIKDLCS